MNAVVKAQQVKLPAAFGAYQAEMTKEFTGGVVAGFPIISYRGKVWRVRKSGTEQNYLNDQGEPMPSIEVVLLRGNPLPSKTYYDKAYEEGSTEAPRCWSTSGERPDRDVTAPLSPTCAACPKSQWGSGKPSPSGAKTRACADVRRVAVAFAHELEEKGRDATLFLLRVPPSSLNPMKDYVEKGLQPRGIYPFALVTRIGFDPQAAHPKFTFKPARLVNEDEAEAIVALRDSTEVHRMLTEAAEFEGAGTTAPGAVEVASAEDAPAAPAPSASSKKKPPAPRPATEEEVEEEEEAAPAPAAKAAPAPAPAAAQAEEDPFAALTTPKPAPKPAATAPAPAAAAPAAPAAPKPAKKPKPAPAAAAAPAAPAAAEEGQDFESMLDSILQA